MTEQFCPCCGRHCPLTNPSCERGKAYVCGEHEFEIHGERNHGHRHQHSNRYDNMDIDSKLIGNIRDMGHTVRALSDGKAGQSRILIIVNEEEEIAQNELTELLGVQPGTVSEVIGKLENAGLIERVESEQDRRTCRLKLTRDGKQIAEQASAERKNRYDQMFSCLSESEKTELLVLLEKVNNDWQARYGNGRFGHHGGHHRHGGRHER